MTPSFTWNRQQHIGRGGGGGSRSRFRDVRPFLFGTPNSFGCSKKRKEGENGHTLQRAPGMNKVGYNGKALPGDMTPGVKGENKKGKE